MRCRKRNVADVSGEVGVNRALSTDIWPELDQVVKRPAQMAGVGEND